MERLPGRVHVRRIRMRPTTAQLDADRIDHSTPRRTRWPRRMSRLAFMALCVCLLLNVCSAQLTDSSSSGNATTIAPTRRPVPTPPPITLPPTTPRPTTSRPTTPTPTTPTPTTPEPTQPPETEAPPEPITPFPRPTVAPPADAPPTEEPSLTLGPGVDPSATETSKPDVPVTPLPAVVSREPVAAPPTPKPTPTPQPAPTKKVIEEAAATTTPPPSQGASAETAAVKSNGTLSSPLVMVLIIGSVMFVVLGAAVFIITKVKRREEEDEDDKAQSRRVRDHEPGNGDLNVSTRFAPAYAQLSPVRQPQHQYQDQYHQQQQQQQYPPQQHYDKNLSQLLGAKPLTKSDSTARYDDSPIDYDDSAFDVLTPQSDIVLAHPSSQASFSSDADVVMMESLGPRGTDNSHANSGFRAEDPSITSVSQVPGFYPRETGENDISGDLDVDVDDDDDDDDDDFRSLHDSTSTPPDQGGLPWGQAAVSVGTSVSAFSDIDEFHDYEGYGYDTRGTENSYGTRSARTASDAPSYTSGYDSQRSGQQSDRLDSELFSDYGSEFDDRESSLPRGPSSVLASGYKNSGSSDLSSGDEFHDHDSDDYYDGRASSEYYK